MNLLELFASLVLDTSDYKSGIKVAVDEAKTAEDGLEKLEKEAKSTGDELGEAGEKSESTGKSFKELARGGLKKVTDGFATAVKVGTALVGAMTAVAGAITATTGRVARHGDEIDKASQKLGISAQAYQEWDHILRHNGASVGSMETSMKTLAKAMADGDEELTKLLGVTKEQLKTMSQEEAYAKTIEALQKMENGAERTALAQKLLGRSALEYGALLNQTAEETEAMRQELHRLGGVMSDEAVRASARYTDALQDLQTGFSGMKTQLISTFLPSIVTVMTGLTSLFKGDSEEGLGAINEGITEFLNGMAERLPEFAERGMAIIATIAKAFIDNIPTIIASGVEILTKLLNSMTDKMPAFISWAVDLVLTIGKTMLENAPALIGSAIELLGSLLGGITGKLIELGTNIVMGIWDGMKNMKDWLIQQVLGLFNSLVDGVKSFLGIASPSKVFAGIGKNMVAGLGEGWDNNIDRVVDGINSDLNFSATSPAMAGAGYGNTYVFNFTGDINAQGDYRTIAQRIIDEIDDTLGRRL